MAPTDATFHSAIGELEQMYAALPTLDCLGLCEDSCHTHIDASTTERARLQAAGVDLDQPTTTGHCPALKDTFGSGRCSVYAVRPMVCRLWGVADSMRCPHGCTPTGGHVPDARTIRWLLDSLIVGGHPTIGAPVLDVLELAVADEHAAGLLGLFLRGDRTVVPALYDHLQMLRSRTAAIPRRR